MPKMGRSFYQAYENSMELEDTRILRISYVIKREQSSYDEDDQSETLFFLDRTLICREDLPAEITDDVITKLEDNASPDRNFDYGGPDLDFEPRGGSDGGPWGSFSMG